MEEIKNKIKESSLIQMDLAHFKPKLTVVGLDIANQLWQGLVLKEKDFRTWIKTEDWERYENLAVYIHCSADAIIPTWAYMLIAVALAPHTSKVIIGSKLDLEKSLIEENIEKLEVSDFQNGKVIVKGCSDITCPEFAMVKLVQKLQPVVQSIMYGEPCSTVPIFKRK